MNKYHMISITFSSKENISSEESRWELYTTINELRWEFVRELIL